MVHRRSGRRSSSCSRSSVQDVRNLLPIARPTTLPPSRMGRTEAGQPLWKRLAYVAITRAQERLIWVVRNRLSRPTQPLRVDDLKRIAPAPLTLAEPKEEEPS